MNFAPGIEIEVRVKDHHAVANNQETVNWDFLCQHIIDSFSQYGRVETLALRARSLPGGTRELVGCDRTTYTKEQDQQAHSAKRSAAEFRHQVQQRQHAFDFTSMLHEGHSIDGLTRKAIAGDASSYRVLYFRETLPPVPEVLSGIRKLARNGGRGDRSASSIQQIHTSLNGTSGPEYLPSPSSARGGHGNLTCLAQPKPFAAWLRPLFRKDWVVYSQHPFGGPEYVLQYLGRYTHRVAISNHRLVSFAEGKVTFRWRDSAHNNEQKLMTLSLDEFLRRFLLHVLPKGFVRIRNFGFLASRKRATLLPLCFHLLGSAPPAEQDISSSKAPSDLWLCPKCGGPMMVIERLTAAEIQLRSPPSLVTEAA